MGRIKSILPLLILIILFLSCSILFFLPFKKKVVSSAEGVLCKFEDGTSGTEYELRKLKILGADGENILIEKDGKAGRVRADAEFLRAMKTYESGDLFGLLTFRLGECDKFGRIALYEILGDICLYADEPLCWDGNSFVPADRTRFKTVDLLSGSLESSFLKETGAEKLILRKGATLTAKDLVGSKVSTVSASAPYEVRDGGIYLRSGETLKFVAAFPDAEELLLDADLLASGSLSPCTKLKKLIFGRHYELTLSDLFGETPIPEGIEVEEIF